MVWLAWRQHRLELIVLIAGAAILAAVTAVYASFAQQSRIELGVDTCTPLPTGNFNCFELGQEWQRRVGPGRFIFFGFYIVPAIIASYLGGPLFARELERGTHRLAWTQGIGRLRWAATKLGVALAFALAAGVVLALVGGQTRHLMGVSGYRPWDTFDQEGPAFVSFIVFGLVAGAFFGAWRRQILAGMFYGLLAFALVRGLVIELRPRYEPPVAILATPSAIFPTYGTATTPVPSDAWRLGGDAVDDQGRTVPPERVQELLNGFRGCPAGQSCDSITYLAGLGVHQRVLYQPADRYGRFQATESAIYLALAAALAAATLWLVRRRDA